MNTDITQRPIGNESRDAIHVAVVPVQAATLLQPGDRVRIDENGRARLTRDAVIDGVVSPFMPHGLIKVDDWCWVMLRPGLVDDMKHVWACRSLDKFLAPPSSEESARRRAYAEDHLTRLSGKLGISLNQTIEALSYGGCADTDLDWQGEIQEADWEAYESYTGWRRPENCNKYFRCAC